MRISFVEKETTMTTDKNNSCHPGATAPGFKIAARFRGEKEDVVFTSCSGCFQNNLQASASRGALTGKAAILAARASSAARIRRVVFKQLFPI